MTPQTTRTLRKIIIHDLDTDNTIRRCYSGFILFNDEHEFPKCLAYIPSSHKTFGMLAICAFYDCEDGEEIWTLAAPAATLDLWSHQDRCINKIMDIIEEERADVAMETA